MTAKVTEQGVLIPKALLGEAEEVEIHRENNLVIITPAMRRDPILELGSHPVVADVDDTSAHHDAYLIQT